MSIEHSRRKWYVAETKRPSDVKETMEPNFNDYVALIYNCLEAFTHVSDVVSKMGHPFVYEQRSMIVFFMGMPFKRISHFMSQWHWLKTNPEMLRILG